MTPFQTKQGKFLAVDVPSGTVRVSKPIMSEPHGKLFITAYYEGGRKTIFLPTLDTYTPIGIASDLTEAQWVEVVGAPLTHDLLFDFATDHALSLLAANNIQTNRLILKIEE